MAPVETRCQSVFIFFQICSIISPTDNTTGSFRAPCQPAVPFPPHDQPQLPEPQDTRTRAPGGALQGLGRDPGCWISPTDPSWDHGGSSARSPTFGSDELHRGWLRPTGTRGQRTDLHPAAKRCALLVHPAAGLHLYCAEDSGGEPASPRPHRPTTGPAAARTPCPPCLLLRARRTGAIPPGNDLGTPASEHGWPSECKLMLINLLSIHPYIEVCSVCTNGIINCVYLCPPAANPDLRCSCCPRPRAAPCPVPAHPSPVGAAGVASGMPRGRNVPRASPGASPPLAGQQLVGYIGQVIGRLCTSLTLRVPEPHFLPSRVFGHRHKSPLSPGSDAIVRLRRIKVRHFLQTSDNFHVSFLNPVRYFNNRLKCTVLVPFSSAALTSAECSNTAPQLLPHHQNRRLAHPWGAPPHHCLAHAHGDSLPICAPSL